MPENEQVIVISSLRHLDAMVAEHLFSWRWWLFPQNQENPAWPWGNMLQPPEFSPHPINSLLTVPCETAPVCQAWLEDKIKGSTLLPRHTTSAQIEPVIKNREEAGYFWEFYQESDALMRGAWTVRLLRLDSLGERQIAASAHHADLAVACSLTALASAGFQIRLNLD